MLTTTREVPKLANVTLIGEKQAKKGNIFIYIGPLSECRDCKVKTVCFNLESGRKYEIKEIRAMHHECKIHEGGVRAVEYEILPVECALEPDAAIEKARITVKEPEDCKNRGCENYYLCFPKGLKSDTQYEIKAVKGKVTCPDGRELMEVLLIDIY